MGIDAFFKRYFFLIVLGLVVLAAFFEAKGASELVGAAVLPDADLLAATPPAASATPVLAHQAKKSAQPILDRNPFDSVTGPLNAPEFSGIPETTAEPDVTDPLRAPACDQIRVIIVTESTDPLWSLAALQGPGEDQPVIRRVGDHVGELQVAYVGFNTYEGTPAVWMVGGAKLCQALLFAEQPKPEAAAPTAKADKPSRPTRGKGPPALPADMKSKIQKVSANEFNVDRAVVDQILENQATLMRSARIVPEQKDGKVVGVRLFGIRPDTLLGVLGFQNGDRLETINGFSMSSPEKALEAYSRLRTAEKLSVTVSRRGQPTAIDYNIK